MRFAAILFDFDGVLIDSEATGNRHVADYLTGIGHPTSADQAMAQFMGLAGPAFITAIERAIGRPLPEDFHAAREIENQRVLADGIDPVAGAVAFVHALPPAVPIAIVSSSSTHWIETHLAHIGLLDRFAGRIFSGREHVARGKPAPDIYLHAAQALGIPIARAVIIEDSPVGAEGAVASGAHVIGFCAGSHCPPDHAARLRALGVHDIAPDFETIAALIS
ncbi:HAD family phosphatase [Sphingomonas sp. 1P06PA]|uniref:HAD family hydrolase n=1 Tax=Sphingomonas sp. 1P06PA TaxID=554121 RepID=UPI0039A78205